MAQQELETKESRGGEKGGKIIVKLKSLNVRVMSKRERKPQSLEVQYLQALRELDSQTIALDFDRREIRRRRQLIAEKDRSLSKRRRRMEKIQEKLAEREVAYSKEIEREVESLQAQLKATKRELQKVREASIVTNPPKSIFDFPDQTYQLSYLRDQERQLKVQIKELEERATRAQQTLSEPVDDTRMDQALIDNVEDDADLVENQLESMADVQDFDDYEIICEKVSQIEEKNRERKKELGKRKAQLTSETYTLKLKRREPLKQIRSREREAPAPRETSKRENLSSFIDEMFQAFVARQKKINQNEQETDILDAKNKQGRKETEEDWNRKADQVKELSTTLREIEQTKMQISELEETIENNKSELTGLISEKEKIKRRISNILRDRDYNSQKNAEHRKLVESLNTRKLELETHDKELAEKKRQLELESKRMDTFEVTVNSRTKEVEALDEQTKNLAVQSDKRIAEIQESAAEFEALRLTVITEDGNNAVFDEEFLKTLRQ